MNENNGNNIALRTISLKDLWNVLRGCFVFVLLAVVLVTGVSYLFAKKDYVPLYSSTATVYLIGVYEGEFDMYEFANDYNIAFRIIDECMIMLRSRTVLNAVGEDIGIKNGYGNLSGRVSITNPEDTRVIYITATDTTPEGAKQIVDSVCKCGAREINDMFAYDKFRVFEEGTVNYGAVNNFGVTNYLKYGIIAGVIVYIVFLAIGLFDNYIHTEEDIENYLGLTILGDIPDANAPDKRKKVYTNYTGNSNASYKAYGNETDRKRKNK